MTFMCGAVPKCEEQCGRCAYESAPTATSLHRLNDCPEQKKPDEQKLVAETPLKFTTKALGIAADHVYGPRGRDYGHPLDNHSATARMFAVYLERKYGVKLALDADDTCWFNVLQKASRDANEPKDDNPVDVAGYAENLAMVRAERARRNR